MLDCGIFGVQWNMMEKGKQCEGCAGTNKMDNALEMFKSIGMTIMGDGDGHIANKIVKN